MFGVLGRVAADHPGKICAAWLVLAIALGLLAPSWNSQAQDDDIHFLPARCDSVRGYELLQQAFPRDVFASKAIFVVERGDGKLTESDLKLVNQMAEDLAELGEEEPGLGIGRVYSRRDPFIGKRLESADGQCTLLQVSLATPYLALQTQHAIDRAEERLRRRLEQGDAGLRMFATGAAGVGRDLVSASDQSLRGTTIATVALVVVILLLVYRSPLLALVPLLTIGLSVWVALEGLALLTLVPGFYLVNVSKVFAVVLLYGAGTDYCLFLISRYREEWARGHGVENAVRRSVGGVGGALAASAATVICGLGLMGVAEFAKVRCAGPAIALSLAVVLGASLTLTPALLRLFGAAVFWPRNGTQTGDSRGLGLWDRISDNVVRRPILTWAIALAALLPFVAIGLRVRADYKPTGELSSTSGSIQGMAAIQRHFTPGETGPITVLLASPNDWSAAPGQQLIRHLSEGFARLENVAEVRSLTQPIGPEPVESEPPAKSPERNLLGTLLGRLPQNRNPLRDLARRAARQFYLATIPASDGRGQRYVTRLDVVLRTDPFDARSTETLAVIQTWLREEMPGYGVDTECYGVTANSRDLTEVTEADRNRINLLVMAAVFVVLVLVVRRPGLAVYLLATVLLSYFVTLGTTALAGRFLLGRPQPTVDWRVPFFLFTILVAVGADYNILLVARILQEKKRLGWELGTRRALARTGGTITSCGLVMAGTFATLMMGGLNTLVQIGFALAFGVLLDTLVVRPFLVPAFVLMVARWQAKEREREPQPAWLRLPTPRRKAG
jgi:RND superfamily putative drug exporter